MNEVRSQPTLRYFGSLLGLTHVLTCLFWLTSPNHYVSALTDSLPLCWPFLHGCEDWGRLSPQTVIVLLTLYTAVSAASAFAFLYTKTVLPAFALLATASLIKLGIFLLDYRLSGNYHYMHFWVLFAYFFAVHKALTIRFLLVGFYLGAGVIKLNREWLTGAIFPVGTILTGQWLKVACAYVVVLELVLVFGLFAKRRWIFWVTLTQLFIFHAVSYFYVGFYYPSLFFCFLALFVMCEVKQGQPLRIFQLAELPWNSRAILAGFVGLQLIPWVLGGDRALDGRGRLLSLTMFDARPQCEMRIVARFSVGEERLPARYASMVDPRLICDPHVMLADARHYCRKLENDGEFKDMNISLHSKRQTDAQFREVFSFQDFCSQPKRMNVLGLIESYSDS